MMAHENDPHWSGIKNYNWKEYSFWAFIVSFGVEGLWMFFSGAPVWGTLVESAIFIGVSNAFFPIVLGLLSWGVYRLLSKRLGLTGTKDVQKGNASVFGWQVFFGIAFWIAGYFVAKAVLSVSVGIWPPLAIIGGFTGIGILAGNLIGKILNRERLGIRDNQEYWKDTAKECFAFLVCGIVSGALFQWIAGFTMVSGIGLGLAQFAIMTGAAFLIFTVGYLVFYKVADMIVEGRFHAKSVKESNKSDLQNPVVPSLRNGQGHDQVRSSENLMAESPEEVVAGSPPSSLHAPSPRLSFVSNTTGASNTHKGTDHESPPPDPQDTSGLKINMLP